MHHLALALQAQGHTVTGSDDEIYEPARARLHQEFSVGETPWFPWVMSRLPLNSGDHVLDIGCGPAWLWAASQGHFPTGLHLTLADQSTGMVTEATERCTPLRFASVVGETTDVTALPFADGKFDTVIAMHMLYHVADQQRAIAELHRVLKPGGKLYALTPAYPNASVFTDPTHVNFITLGTWRYFCFDAGTPPMAQMYGYTGSFKMLRNEWGMVPEAFNAASTMNWKRQLRRWNLQRRGRLSHLLWEFECIKRLT